MIFSIKFMKELMKQINKLQFNAIPKANSFVEKVENDWVTATSSTPNSYELSCSIYSSLEICSLDKVCVIEVREQVITIDLALGLMLNKKAESMNNRINTNDLSKANTANSKKCLCHAL